MELTGILFLVLMLAVLGLFIFGLVKAFSSWGLWYTVTLVFLFLSTLGFLYASASVAQRRINWVRVHDNAKEKAERLKREIATLKFGNPNQPSTTLDSLLGLANELNRMSLERGRVWRGAGLVDFKNDTVTLNLAPPPPAAPADPDVPVEATVAPAPVGDLPSEALVYAFGESAGEDGKVIPRVYLGEYFVVDSKGGKATLRSIAPLLPKQSQSIKSGESSSWTLFELMPLDSHNAFAEPGSEKTPEAEFGRMDRAVLAKLLQLSEELVDRDPSQLTPEESRQRALLRSYVLDGGRAPENEAPENVWLRIEFLEQHEEIVDDTEAEGRKSTDGGYFDFSGRAVDSRLKRKDGEGKVVFEKGQQALFASAPAKALIDDGKAKLIEPVFVRQLNDYSLGFKDTRDRLSAADQDKSRVEREIESTKRTNDRAQEQIVFRQSERQLLDRDAAQYQKELEIIQAEATRFAQAVDSSKTELSRLYQLTQQHYERLVATQKALHEAASSRAN